MKIHVAITLAICVSAICALQCFECDKDCTDHTKVQCPDDQFYCKTMYENVTVIMTKGCAKEEECQSEENKEALKCCGKDLCNEEIMPAITTTPGAMTKGSRNSSLKNIAELATLILSLSLTTVYYI